MTRNMAAALDTADPLAHFRARFASPADPRLLYMDGNSLGRPPVETAALVQRTLDAWRDDLILAWREWIRVPRRLGDLMAGSVLEATPGEVIFGDSTSINLYKAAAAALTARPRRRTIVTSDDNFPTDMHVLRSLASQLSLKLVAVPADPVHGLDATWLYKAVNDDTALVCLTHVAYRSGALLDMKAVTRIAHAAGAMMLWDVSHSAGAVEVPLESSGADLAVGCGYKYLNGGPGAPAFIYVRRYHQESLRHPLWGWFGHRDQFSMSSEFEPADGIERFLVGAPAILSTLAIEPGLKLVRDAGIARLQEKGRKLTDLMIRLADEWLTPQGFSLASPRDPSRRGSHVSLRHPNARSIVKALIADAVIPDYRPPDLVRLGPAPLYTRFVDVWDAMNRLRRLCEGQLSVRTASYQSTMKTEKSGF
jgi:kynureninase